MCMQISFAQKVRRNKKVIIYEFLPPPIDSTQKDLDELASFLTRILSRFPVDAVNLPEIRDEIESNGHNFLIMPKMEPRVLAPYLRKYGVKDAIVNRPIVYLPWEKQKLWLKESYEKYKIRNFIFVGGNSSGISYPGLSVVEAAKIVTGKLKSLFPDIFLGGITMASRKNETDRLLHKTLAGIEYFTSQIVYESQPVKNLLKEYWRLTRERGIQPKMIFLSFAPVTTLRDMEFLEWLGVTIPSETKRRLTNGWLGMGWRSIGICEKLLEDIIMFVSREKIGIPLGINVEYITKHNFELSFQLLEVLSKAYFDY